MPLQNGPAKHQWAPWVTQPIVGDCLHLSAAIAPDDQPIPKRSVIASTKSRSTPNCRIFGRLLCWSIACPGRSPPADVRSTTAGVWTAVPSTKPARHKDVAGCPHGRCARPEGRQAGPLHIWLRRRPAAAANAIRPEARLHVVGSDLEVRPNTFDPGSKNGPKLLQFRRSGRRRPGLCCPPIRSLTGSDAPLVVGAAGSPSDAWVRGEILSVLVGGPGPEFHSRISNPQGSPVRLPDPQQYSHGSQGPGSNPNHPEAAQLHPVQSNLDPAVQVSGPLVNLAVRDGLHQLQLTFGGSYRPVSIRDLNTGKCKSER